MAPGCGTATEHAVGWSVGSFGGRRAVAHAGEWRDRAPFSIRRPDDLRMVVFAEAGGATPFWIALCLVRWLRPDLASTARVTTPGAAGGGQHGRVPATSFRACAGAPCTTPASALTRPRRRTPGSTCAATWRRRGC